MVGGVAGVEGAHLPQQGQLGPVADGEDPLARGAGVPLLVEGQAEGLAEQARQPLGKGGGFGDDLHLVQGEPVAVKKHPAGFRLGGALVPQFSPAQFGFYIPAKDMVLSPSQNAGPASQTSADCD